MDRQLRGLPVLLRAARKVTLERFLPGMRKKMLPLRLLARELQPADLTTEILDVKVAGTDVPL